MKAIIYKNYGAPEVLQNAEIEKPSNQDNEVLIKVKATTVHRGDTRMRALDIPKIDALGFASLMARLYLGFLKPKRQILGIELAGTIEKIGKNVTRYKVGDEVFATTEWAGLGGYAEYKCMDEEGAIALKPDNISFEEAATLPAAGLTIIQIFKKIDNFQGKSILIYGASGSLGSLAVQYAKSFGASVTGVCSGSNVNLVKSLGADDVIDYTQENFWEKPARYSVIFDAVGELSKKQAKAVLQDDGVYLSAHSSAGGIKEKDGRPYLEELKNMVETGKIKPVLDRSYSFNDMVEAHRYVDTARKKGNVAISFD